MLKFNSALRTKHQGSTAEVTVALQLNQGVCTDVLYYHPCLNFLWLLSFFQDKESNKSLLVNKCKKPTDKLFRRNRCLTPVENEISVCTEMTCERLSGPKILTKREPPTAPPQA